jgi:hypothetical protein
MDLEERLPNTLRLEDECRSLLVRSPCLRARADAMGGTKTPPAPAHHTA